MNIAVTKRIACSSAMICILLILSACMRMQSPVIGKDPAPSEEPSEQKKIFMVYLDWETSAEDIQQIENTIKDFEYVKSIEFFSTEKGTDLTRDLLNEKGQGYLDKYTSSGNPLPNAFIVTLTSGEYYERVLNQIKKLNTVPFGGPIIGIT